MGAGIINDILLLYGLVWHWDPEGVRCKTPGPRGSQFGLGMAFLGLGWVNLGAWLVSTWVGVVLDCSFFAQKTTILG